MKVNWERWGLAGSSLGLVGWGVSFYRAVTGAAITAFGAVEPQIEPWKILFERYWVVGLGLGFLWGVSLWRVVKKSRTGETRKQITPVRVSRGMPG